MRMPEQEAHRSDQVRLYRHAVECRLRHRPILLPRPIPVNLRQPDPVDASTMANSTGSSGAGSSSMCLEKSSSRAWSVAVSSTNQSSTVAEVRDCSSSPFGRRLSSLCPIHHDVVERAVDVGAGRSGARVRVDAALEAAEDGNVAGLQIRSAVRGDEAQHARQRRPHVGHGGLADRDAGHVPEKEPPFSDVTWRVRSGQGCSGKTASVLPASTICTSFSSELRFMLKGTVNVVAFLVLHCS